MSNPFMKVRPISQATRATKLKAKNCTGAIWLLLYDQARVHTHSLFKVKFKKTCWGEAHLLKTFPVTCGIRTFYLHFFKYLK